MFTALPIVESWYTEATWNKHEQREITIGQIII